MAIQSRLTELNGLSQVAWASISSSELALKNLLSGDRFSLFIVLPRHTIRSYGFLLRIWIGTLLQIFAHQTLGKKSAVLLILDECQELRQLGDLASAMTLGWPKNVLIWSIWSSPASLRVTYPTKWVAIIENSLAIQVLGPVGYNVEAEIEALLEAEPNTVASLVQRQQLARVGSKLLKLQL